MMMLSERLYVLGKYQVHVLLEFEPRDMYEEVEEVSGHNNKVRSKYRDPKSGENCKSGVYPPTYATLSGIEEARAMGSREEA